MSVLTFDNILAATLSEVRLLEAEGSLVQSCRLATEEAPWHRRHPMSVM